MRAGRVAGVKFRLGIAALRFISILLVTSALVHGVPVHAAPHKKISKIRDLADSVGSNVILTKFSALVAASNMGTFLSSRGPFTLFAPTNSAFSKLPPGMFEDMLLPENQAQLQRIVLFHLVNGKIIDAKDLTPLKSLISCEGSPLPLHTAKSGTHFILKARILRADMKCANGIMHQIDTMLMPPNLVLVSKVPGGTPPATGAVDSTNSAPGTNLAPVAGTDAMSTNSAPASNIQ